MPTTLTPSKPKLRELPKHPRSEHGGGGGGGTPPGRGGGDGGGGTDPSALSVQRYKLGVWVGFGGIVMVFAAFTSAMVVRKGLGDDWASYQLPAILWFSTAVLLASSFTMEKAKRALRAAGTAGFERWLTITGGLGAVFLTAQLLGWRELAGNGIYLASNPSSSFFYLFTAAHGLHLFGGLLALTYVVFRAWSGSFWATREAAVEGAALYWHLMDVLWVYLFVLLLIWR